MRGQTGSPKPTEASGKNEMKCPYPDTNATSAMFKSDILPTRQLLWFHFSPPFLASTPVIFNKLDGDSICLESVILMMSDVIKF